MIPFATFRPVSAERRAECGKSIDPLPGRDQKRPATTVQRTWTVDTGSPGSPVSSGPEAAPPAATTCAPTAAIIAPLSVHSPGRGTRRVRPAAAHRSSASARSRRLAATPPGDDHRADPQVGGRAHGLGGEHVHHRLLEDRAHVRHVDRPAVPLRRLDVPGDRRLQPGEARSRRRASRGPVSPRGNRDRRPGRRRRPAGRSPDRPDSRARAAGRPCRRPRRRRRRRWCRSR